MSNFRVHTETKNNCEQEENDEDVTAATETLCRVVQEEDIGARHGDSVNFLQHINH